ncbi:glutathione binding-like protein [Alphaproteobacteria bacterium]|nr:glutathione binding-like protein [Alphaproteobacteria bacterium]
MKNKIFLYDLSGKNNIRFSPPCWNVKLCLIHNNIDFETIPIRFTEKNKINFSNQTLVPIVKCGDEIITDSWGIFVWLNNKIKEIKLIPNEQTRVFSHFLYFWTSKSLLPLIFKLIANDIPKILDEEDKQYFIETRENRIKKPLKSLLIDKTKSRKQLFQSLITFEKVLAENKFFNGNNPGLPDFIFFGNFMWAEKCSSENLFENLPNIQKWYFNIKKLNRL